MVWFLRRRRYIPQPRVSDEVAHPGYVAQSNAFTLKALHTIGGATPFGVDDMFGLLTQGGAAAPLTLGCGM